MTLVVRAIRLKIKVHQMHINSSNHQTNQISTQCDLDPGRGQDRSFNYFQMTWKGLSIRLFFFKPRQVVRLKIKIVAL